MNGAAIVPAPDIDKRAIADRKRPAGGERQRGLYRPSASQLFVVINRDAGGVVSAGRHDAAVIYCSSVEPQPGHVHGRPAAPTVCNRVEDLRGGDGRGEWSCAPEQVEFPLVHGAARPCYWRWHRRTSAPRVGRDVIDLQLGPFAGAVVTAGNV
jgi:hypothetical protein